MIQNGNNQEFKILLIHKINLGNKFFGVDILKLEVLKKFFVLVTYDNLKRCARFGLKSLEA